ncbi:12-oxophytodienoate reductase 1 [Phytophthora boehmeriae]|uniref:12-oxophytodienoate reductase 1 n=1 Tax=Phytophthora boehmeriae TaxID=109152 RepID=A0A8T1X7F5_9STRA|nr:12-oxophytodienoate reductase 1 [Phytophthora boehmeriae]
MVSASNIPKLFTPITLGGKLNQLTLNHRVVMAPLTRLKHGEEGVPPEITATYYGQRATKGGLIIAEATNISPTARGYLGAPGIFTQQQIAAWKRVTDTVHAKEGNMFLQLWHTGRISHPLNQPDGQLPVSSSAKMDVSTGWTNTREGRKPHVPPRALETEEIPLIVQDYKKAAENALAAGFDGIEFHCANGYLLEQFLQDGINDRTDRYGGSVENRARFLFEALDAILEVVDSSRVGIRLSPYGMSFGQFESDPVGTYGYVLKKLNDYNLAYVHLIEPRAFALHENPNAPTDGSMTRTFRSIYNGVLLTASGYDRQSAVDTVENGDADMVALGRYFISNPDLVKRLELNAPLNPYNPKTFYTAGEVGYTDQPFLEDAKTAESSL